MWVGNFGFQDPPCATLPVAATSDSVSLFDPDGTAISGIGGHTNGDISWPQGTVSDRQGNVWIVNNRGNTVSVVSPEGELIDTLPGTFEGRTVLSHLVGNAADTQGNIWLTNNWKRDANPVVNPFGNAIVVAIGAAEPVKTPLIGPPVGF